MRGPRRWQNRLGDQCSRWTVTRQAVLDLLSEKPGHWSAKDIRASLGEACPGIGLMTVYRTLDLLERTGIVHKIALADGQARYEIKPTAKKDHHHHLICTECGRIVDYSDFLAEELELVRKTEESLTRKHGFRILDHNIEFLGLCDKCRNDKNDRGGRTGAE